MKAMPMNPSKRNLYILTFVLFVVMLGYGIVIPILPFYIESMGAGGTELGFLVASYFGLCRHDGLVRARQHVVDAVRGSHPFGRTLLRHCTDHHGLHRR
jgi:hypothetical protein